MLESVSTRTPPRAVAHTGPQLLAAQGFALPAWVLEAMRGGRVERTAGARAVHLADAGSVSLVSGAIPRARARGADELRAEVATLYGVLRSCLAATSAPHPVRVWNWIPGIHEAIGPGLSRYYAFNQGRFDAFCSWLGDPAAFDGALPTATGVGHDGDDLAVHMLGAASPGRAVENPRQRPAWRYSRRYGPRPPCFARATIAGLGDLQALLVGGTASVRGEDTVYPASLGSQVDESLENIGALLRAAAGESAGLDMIREARVYFPRAADSAALQAMMRDRLPSADVEMVRAEPCRRDLLVEIEAIADLAKPSS